MYIIFELLWGVKDKILAWKLLSKGLCFYIFFCENNFLYFLIEVIIFCCVNMPQFIYPPLTFLILSKFLSKKEELQTRDILGQHVPRLPPSHSQTLPQLPLHQTSHRSGHWPSCTLTAGPCLAPSLPLRAPNPLPARPQQSPSAWKGPLPCRTSHTPSTHCFSRAALITGTCNLFGSHLPTWTLY